MSYDMMRRSPDGGVLVTRGLRVDATVYQGISMLSASCELETLEREENRGLVIPALYRPLLVDFKPLVSSGSSCSISGAQGSNGYEGRGFSLSSLTENGRAGRHGLRGGIENLPLDFFDESSSYRVVGFLPGRPEEAVPKVLMAPQLPPELWVPLARVYDLMTQRDAEWIGGLPGAVSLSSAEWSGVTMPPVPSARFQMAARNVLKALLKPQWNAVLIKGDAGAGKSCLVSGLGRHFRNMRVPGRLQGYLVAGINIETFLPSYQSREEVEKAQMRAEMARRRVIYVIEEASRLVDRGGTVALDNLLLLIDLGARVVLLSDQAHLLEERPAFMRRLNPVYLPPADEGEVAEIAASLAGHMASRTGLIISPEAVSDAVVLSGGSPFAQPHAVVSLLTGAVVGCEIRGEKEVSRDCVAREYGEMLSQGYSPHSIPETVSHFVEAVRAEGFCGHDALLSRLAAGMLPALRRRHKHWRPGGVVWACILVGGHGVGLGMLPGVLGKVMTGTERKVLQIQCSAYRQEHSIQSLLGSPQSYIGYGKGGVLQNFVKQNPDGVLVFKRPEEGHPGLLCLLADVLDGAFTAGDGQVIRTRNLIVLVSTHVGCSQHARAGFVASCEDRESGIVRNVESLLQPDLVARIGRKSIFFMERLDAVALAEILQGVLKKYGTDRGVEIVIEELVTHYIIYERGDPPANAREVLTRYYELVEPLLDREYEKLERLNPSGRGRTIRVFLDGAGAIVCRAASRSSGAYSTLEPGREGFHEG